MEYFFQRCIRTLCSSKTSVKRKTKKCYRTVSDERKQRRRDIRCDTRACVEGKGDCGRDLTEQSAELERELCNPYMTTSRLKSWFWRLYSGCVREYPRSQEMHRELFQGKGRVGCSKSGIWDVCGGGKATVTQWWMWIQVKALWEFSCAAIDLFCKFTMKRPFYCFRRIGVRVVGWRLCHRWAAVPVDLPAVTSWAPFVGKPPSVCIFRSFSLEVGSFRRYLSVISQAGSSGALGRRSRLGTGCVAAFMLQGGRLVPAGLGLPSSETFGLPFWASPSSARVGRAGEASRFRDLRVQWITFNHDSSASFQRPFNFVVFSWSLQGCAFKKQPKQGFLLFCFLLFCCSFRDVSTCVQYIPARTSAALVHRSMLWSVLGSRFSESHTSEEL